MTNRSKAIVAVAFAALAIAVVWASVVLNIRRNALLRAGADSGVSDGPPFLVSTPPPHFGMQFPQPTGTGVPVVSGGQIASAAVNGDSGFVLTSQGTSSVPVYAAPAAASGPDLDAGYVVSATGSGSNEGDAAGAKLPIAATETCEASSTKYSVCSYAVTATWSDATTWQTYFQRAQSASTLSHYYVTFDADDYSGDGGTPIKNFVKTNLEIHAATDTLQTLLVPQAGGDVGPGPMSMAPLAVTTLNTCTTNNSDAGCAPLSTTTWTFQATMTGTLLALQAKAVGTTRWPWSGRILVREVRSSP